MKPISPLQTLSDQLGQLHNMEIHIARELLILAGSALSAPLRRWLSRRAMAARGRRDRLQDFIELHTDPCVARTQDLIRGVLAEGNRELSRIHHPYARDAAIIEHCIRIEQLATTAYGVAVPLTCRIGFPRLSDKLKPLLGDLEAARISFRSLEAEVFSIAAYQPHVSEVNPVMAISANSRYDGKAGAFKPLAVAS